MQVITLYRYLRTDGGVTVSTAQPESEYTTLVRLIADEGKVLQNGDTLVFCVDTESPCGWTEVDAPQEEVEQSEYITRLEAENAELARAYNILTGEDI